MKLKHQKPLKNLAPELKHGSTSVLFPAISGCPSSSGDQVKIQSDQLEKRHQCFWRLLPWKLTWLVFENPPCSLWSTSSNGGVSIVMLVFLGAFFWSFFFFEETEDDTMFVVKQICCSTFWLGCGRCSVYKDHVKSWVFHANYQKQLAFQKEKNTSWNKNPCFFCSFPPAPSQNAAKRRCFFLCHIYWFCWSSTWWGGWETVRCVGVSSS